MLINNFILNIYQVLISPGDTLRWRKRMARIFRCIVDPDIHRTFDRPKHMASLPHACQYRHVATAQSGPKLQRYNFAALKMQHDQLPNNKLTRCGI